ncbi:MAG: iron-containing alcohol dehydrogenase [Lentisphaeria bacterium]|nr:iron-containing alcohol dehydrogenase [Lentisphaeria bacterium]
MEDLEKVAQQILEEWPDKNLVFGINKLDAVVEQAKKLGTTYFLVCGKSSNCSGLKERLDLKLSEIGAHKIGETTGAAPNSPLEDVARVKNELLALLTRPDFVISLGGGSLIDAVKASLVLESLGGFCDDFYGPGLVSQQLKLSGTELIPHCAIMTSSASAAHLTKYSNVTDLEKAQKKLIIDEAITPTISCFDYSETTTMDPDFTTTGALDGLGHLVEVYLGFDGESDQFELVEKVALTGFELIINALPVVLGNLGNITSRAHLGLATDLGGYAIMLGSTNGPHLNSFSLVDLMDHGVAVGILNPYYTYFFSEAVPERVQKLNAILNRAGYLNDNHVFESIGETYLYAIHDFMDRVGAVTKFSDVKGFEVSHIAKMLDAAKDPQLAVKLNAMPIRMSVGDVDVYMKSILNAAFSGSIKELKTLPV